MKLDEKGVPGAPPFFWGDRAGWFSACSPHSSNHSEAVTAYELTCLLVIMILGYRMVHNLLIYRKNRHCEFLLYFAFTQAFFALYLILLLKTINVDPPESALIYERVENATLPVMAAFFVLFVHKFRPIFSTRVLWILIGAFAMFSLVILLHPGAYHKDLMAPKHFPWLGVTIHETEQPVWVMIFLMTMFVVMVRALIKYFFEDSLHRTRSKFLAFALVFLFVTAANDIMVSLQIINFPYVAHFGILVVLFAVENLFNVEIKFNPELALAPDDAGDSVEAVHGTADGVNSPVAAASSVPAGTVPARTDATDSEGEFPVRINCLGPLDIYSGGELVPFTQISRKKKLLKLFKMLLLKYGKWLHKEEVLNALWPELPEKGALNNLHALCFRLRKIFGQPDALVFAEDRLFLNRHMVQVDFIVFEKLLDRTQALYREKNFPAAIAAAESAEKLYRGDFFEFDPYFEGAELMRGHLRQKYKQALLRLCEIYRAEKNFSEMVECSRKAVAIDELDEETWRFHFQALNGAGKKNQALKQYEELKKILRREVDVEPDDDTAELIRKIRDGEASTAQSD